MERIGLLKVGGVCAVSYAIGAVVFLVLLISTGLMEASDATQALPALAEHSTVAAVAAWLLVVLPLLLAVAGLSFFYALRRTGSLMWIAMAAFVGGAFLIIYRGFVWLAVIYELAPAYVAAPEGTKSALAVVGDTLEMFAFMADLIGAALVAGIGVLLFSLALSRSAIAPRWVGRLGIFAAISGGWGTLLGPASEVFELISLVGALAFWIWMAAMGVAIWRIAEPAEA